MITIVILLPGGFYIPTLGLIVLGHKWLSSRSCPRGTLTLVLTVVIQGSTWYLGIVSKPKGIVSLTWTGLCLDL